MPVWVNRDMMEFVSSQNQIKETPYGRVSKKNQRNSSSQEDDASNDDESNENSFEEFE